MGPSFGRPRAVRMGTTLRGPTFEERPQLPAARGMPQLAQRLGLDLPDPLACHGEALAHLFEGVLAPVANAEAHLDDLLLARRERLQHRFGLLARRLASELLHERARRAYQLVDRLDHVDRDADRARLVGDGPRDRLPDPPRGIRRELVAAAILELVDRLHQADVAFLNQV